LSDILLAIHDVAIQDVVDTRQGSQQWTELIDDTNWSLRSNVCVYQYFCCDLF